MKCSDVREELVAYIDNELSPMGMNAIEAHLVECGECTAECEALKGTTEWMHQGACIEPAPDWWEKLQERIRRPAESGTDLQSEVRALRDSIVRMEARMEECLGKLAHGQEIMTLDEVAFYLQIEPDAMWNLLEDIPHFQVGYELRFKKSSVDEWIRMKENGNTDDAFGWDYASNWMDRISPVER